MSCVHRAGLTLCFLLLSLIAVEGGRRESDQSTSSSVLGLAVMEHDIDYNDEHDDFRAMRKGKRGSDVSSVSFSMHPMPDVEDR